MTATHDSCRQIFISYSTVDKVAAEAITRILEESGLSCWIAPRDVPGGSSWPEAITRAIEQCQLFLLVFSPSSDKSDDVLNELTWAGSKEKVLFPVRIQNLQPGMKTAYFLASVQWFDAFEKPIRAYAAALAQAVRDAMPQVLAAAANGEGVTVDIAGRVTGGNSSSGSVQIKDAIAHPPKRRWWRDAVPIVAAAFAMTLLLRWFFSKNNALPLDPVSFCVVLLIFGICAWGVRRLWRGFKQRKESGL